MLMGMKTILLSLVAVMVASNAFAQDSVSVRFKNAYFRHANLGNARADCQQNIENWMEVSNDQVRLELGECTTLTYPASVRMSWSAQLQFDAEGFARTGWYFMQNYWRGEYTPFSRYQEFCEQTIAGNKPVLRPYLYPSDGGWSSGPFDLNQSLVLDQSPGVRASMECMKDSDGDIYCRAVFQRVTQ